MLKRIVLCVIVVGAMASCNFKEKEAAWKHQVDSLEAKLVLHTDAMQTLDEVGTLIDSIDASRAVLRSEMVEGLPHDSYTARLGEINDYVKASRLKLEDLEKALKKNRGSNASLNKVVAKLKEDLQLRTDEVAMLTAEVQRYKSENENLTTTVGMQSAELNDKLEQLNTKQAEVAKLEEQVKSMIAQTSNDMADQYYLRAQALEEAAKRTNFAPKKKKNTKQEALELYRLAALSGKEEAAEKVRQLEN